MSIISLTSHFLCSYDHPPETVTLADVGLPPGMPAPAKGLTLLFGFKDAIDEMSRRWKEARERDLHLVTVIVKVEVGELHRLRLNPADTPSYKSLYLDRLGQQTYAEMARELDKLRPDEAGDWENPFVPAGYATSRPDLMGRMIDGLKDSLFPALEVVIYRVDDPETGPRRVATLLSSASVVSVEPQGVPTKVLLPGDLALP